MRRKHWAALLAALLLGLMVLQSAWMPADSAMSGAAMDASPASAGSTVVDRGVLPLAAMEVQAGPSSHPSASESSDDAEDEREARGAEAYWCAKVARPGQGAQGMALPAYEANYTEFEAMSKADSERMERRLLRRLRTDPSTRAQAAAEWLSRGTRAQSAARLQDLARKSRDPMIIALALQIPCTPGGDCNPVAPGLWAEVEPDNLYALLHAADAAAGEPAVQRWSRPLQARHADSHMAEFVRVLEQHMPPVAETGLQRTTQDVLLTGYWMGGGVLPLRGLLQACRGTELGDSRQRICEGVAEQLWAEQGGSLIDHLLALGLVRLLPERGAHWPARAQQAEAAQQWGYERIDVEIGMLIEATACRPISQQSTWRRRRSAEGEWNVIRGEMAQAAADEAALAERFRVGRSGRGALDPPLPVPAASSAAQR